MNVLIYDFRGIKDQLNGATIYSHNLAKMCLAWGWQVRQCVMAYHGDVYDCEGYDVHPYVHVKQLIREWADIIITTPGHTTRLSSQIPVVYIQHNEVKEPFRIDHGHVIYCANHVQAKINYKCKGSIVMWPPNRYAKIRPVKRQERQFITLVNCNSNKGGKVLISLAERYRNWQFLGLTSGYGVQHKGNLHNLTYREGNYDLAEALADTNVLIMPSEKEGMPTVAMEALALGIPVVTSNIDAFVEMGLADKTGGVPGAVVSAKLQQVMDDYPAAVLKAKAQSRYISEVQQQQQAAVKNWLQSIYK